MLRVEHPVRLDDLDDWLAWDIELTLRDRHQAFLDERAAGLPAARQASAALSTDIDGATRATGYRRTRASATLVAVQRGLVA